MTTESAFVAKLLPIPCGGCLDSCPRGPAASETSTSVPAPLGKKTERVWRRIKIRYSENAGDGAVMFARVVSWQPLKFEECFGLVASVQGGP